MRDRLGDKVRLQHILDAIKEIEDYTEGVAFDVFSSNSMMFNATIRQLEIIGEACNRLSEGIYANNADIPWKSIIGLRNMVIHEYFGVDDITIWNIISINLPELKPKLYLIFNNL